MRNTEKLSRETRWVYHAADGGVNAKDNTVRNVFNDAWSKRVD